MSRTVIRGGRVFRPDGSFENLDLALSNGHFVDIGRRLSGEVILDARGLTLLPGLFDCHVHLLVHDIDVWRSAQLPISYQVLEATRHLADTLASGVTTVRDAAGADLGLKNAVRDGLVRGPRMQIAISMLSQTGGHGDYTLPSGVCAGILPCLPGSPHGVVDGVIDVRRKVREVLRAGADVIKVAASGGVLSPRDDPRHAHFRPDELAAIVDEAAAAGVPVMAHALSTEGIKAAVRAGVRSIEHGVYLDDEAVSMMVDHQVYLVPTLSAGRSVLRAAENGAAVHADTLAKQQAAINHHAASFRRAAEAGVKIAMGTDAGVTPHGENLWELELMAANGLAAEQALHAATSTAAELLGVEAELGTIESGKRADLVLVDGDVFPLAGLAKRIVGVFKDGEQMTGEPLRMISETVREDQN